MYHKVCIIENNYCYEKGIEDVGLDWIFHIFERFQVVHVDFSRVDDSFKSILLDSKLTTCKFLEHFLSLKTICRFVGAIAFEVTKFNIIQFYSIVAHFALKNEVLHLWAFSFRLCIENLVINVLNWQSKIDAKVSEIRNKPSFSFLDYFALNRKNYTSIWP